MLYDEHDDIILGRPFVKLLNVVLDIGKGKVTINTDGTNYTYDFLPTSRQSLALSPDNGELEDAYFAESNLSGTLCKELLRMHITKILARS